jgi:hypothetical protein
MTTHWISRDIAYCIKEAVDPITYGRLLPVAKVFGGKNENMFQRKEKLQQLADELPSTLKPVKTRSAYIFFCKERRPSLKEELPEAKATEIMQQLGVPEAKATEIMQQLGVEWRRMGPEERLPYEQKRDEDGTRFRREQDPAVWAALTTRRERVMAALAAIDEEALLQAAQEITVRKRRRANTEVWKATRGMWYGSPAWRNQQQIVYLKHKVPRNGRSAYNFFMSEMNSQVRKEFGPLQQGEFRSQYNKRLMKEVGRRWKALTPEQKKPYQELAREDKLKIARQTIKDVKKNMS